MCVWHCTSQNAASVQLAMLGPSQNQCKPAVVIVVDVVAYAGHWPDLCLVGWLTISIHLFSTKWEAKDWMTTRSVIW
jgi:hypothetical protein